ncbi:MAG: glycosyltransferase [Muribaculaceae bacterium]|nr:glycosyltransferase [Muribaculaceae bacterium]
MRRILHINTAGGRGAAGGIPEALGTMACRNGLDAVLAGSRRNGTQAPWMSIGSRADMAVHWAATRLADRHGLHSRSATRRFVEQAEAMDPDVVHLHNIHGYYLHLATLFDWLRRSGRPVVWTLHDCWAMTGHCAFFPPHGCPGWAGGCRECSEAGSYPASRGISRSAANYSLKQRLFTSVERMTLVPVSRWLDGVVEQSFLRDLPRRVVYNGIDLDTFRPREELRAPADSPLLLGVASHWDFRKGFDHFLELRRLLPAHWRIRLIGLDRAKLRDLPAGIEGLPRISDAATLSAHYAEATMLAVPSRAEGNNITKMEALACGTPVATFDAGGAPEGIDAATGAVIQQGNIGALAEAIRRAPGNFDSAACRNAACRLFDRNKMFNQYLKIYDSL